MTRFTNQLRQLNRLKPSPYLIAHAAYHAGDRPDVPWGTLMEYLLQTGVVLATPHAFLAARACRRHDPEEAHARLSPLPSPPDADCWHIFAAAGELAALLELAPLSAHAWVSYHRRDGQLRRRQLSQFIRRHDQAENASRSRPATAPPAAGECDG